MTEEKTTILGWHGTELGDRLAYNDGRPVKVGKTLTVDVEPFLCHRGLHASPTPVDTLGYVWRQDPRFGTLWRVEVGGVVGEVAPHDNKFVGTSRKALFGIPMQNIHARFKRRALRRYGKDAFSRVSWTEKGTPTGGVIPSTTTARRRWCRSRV